MLMLIKTMKWCMAGEIETIWAKESSYMVTGS